ncbi:MAG TPA: LytR C-terminal domain-containing protein [Alphaproteobacteria bacterium]|jgi:hypothetical protein|nr:LytR C-terminal domain-containing protein [Alphaproteobacteria bacterium]
MASDIRKRMVVEEVGSSEPQSPVVVTPQLEEIKEKVEELQDITGHISEDIEKSEEVQEELVEATEKAMPMDAYVEPVAPPADMPTVKRTMTLNPLVIIIPGILLLGALLGGIVFYLKGVNQIPAEENPVATDTPVVESPTTSPTPASKIDLSKYSIAVFNGSGIVGEAGKAKDLVTKEGFKVGSTSNAATYDYTKTIIKAKSTVDTAFVTKLSEVLGKSYVVDKSQVLDSSSKNEVEVIIGREKAS